MLIYWRALKSIQLGMSWSQLTFTPSFFRGVGWNHQPDILISYLSPYSQPCLFFLRSWSGLRVRPFMPLAKRRPGDPRGCQKLPGWCPKKWDVTLWLCPKFAIENGNLQVIYPWIAWWIFPVRYVRTSPFLSSVNHLFLWAIFQFANC